MTGLQERLSGYWERQLRRMDDRELRHARRLPTWRNRQRRRRLAAVVVLGDLALIAGAASFLLTATWLFFVLWFGGFVVGMGGFVLLRILTGRMTGSFSRLLDEREREWRNRVAFVSYLVVYTLMIVAMFYGLAISEQADSGIRTTMMLAALLVTGSTVPAIVLGWTLPDDDPEDFVEGGEGR